jgi:hypothetical protein
MNRVFLWVTLTGLATSAASIASCNNAAPPVVGSVQENHEISSWEMNHYESDVETASDVSPSCGCPTGQTPLFTLYGSDTSPNGPNGAGACTCVDTSQQ